MSAILLVVDFDWTLADRNTDQFVLQDIAPHIFEKLQQTLEFDPEKIHWNKYCGEAFLQLSREFEKSEILESIARCPVEGTDFLLKMTAHDLIDVHVVSDNNVWFITEILKARGIPMNRVALHSNEMKYGETNEMLLGIHGLHSCSMCRANICKGNILENLLFGGLKSEASTELGRRYSKAIFVGDGHGDLCPCLRLEDSDFVFPRSGFDLAKQIAELQSSESAEERGVKARVHEWSNIREVGEFVLALANGSKDPRLGGEL